MPRAVPRSREDSNAAAYNVPVLDRLVDGSKADLLEHRLPDGILLEDFFGRILHHLLGSPDVGGLKRLLEEDRCDLCLAVPWLVAERLDAADAGSDPALSHDDEEADVARRTQLVTEYEQVRQRLAIHAEMAADLKGDAFQEYLLTEAFHALVAGASVRLRQMSNRYTLEWQDGDFFVVDHDNAGERRRAETLSGGETFMASLCLALQLSDEVLKTSGALQMDSLFIDEGFGTLDADALSEVTDTMEALRQDGGRLIGVISHRPELTDRLPGCIRVHKGAGESTWQLERVG